MLDRDETPKYIYRIMLVILARMSAMSMTINRQHSFAHRGADVNPLYAEPVLQRMLVACSTRASPLSLARMQLRCVIRPSFMSGAFLPSSTSVRLQACRISVTFTYRKVPTPKAGLDVVVADRGNSLVLAVSGPNQALGSVRLPLQDPASRH